MSVSDIIKKNKMLYNICLDIRKGIYCTATLLSPELNTRLHFREKFGRKLNLNHPNTFNEKLLWLKLKRYNNDPLVIQCADKYRVREYVEQCGCGHILNELYDVYDSAEEISWEKLPSQFVLKWNFGAGMNIVCSDKSKLNQDEVIGQLKRWGKCKYWLTYSEMHYKHIPRKIVCERFLQAKDGSDTIPDYKVYCFHGEPKAILVMHDRGKKIRSEFFDTNWNVLENTENYMSTEQLSPAPECLDDMLEVSKKLSAKFPFVRCDYYNVNGKLYFGELTFTPACGLYTSQTAIGGKDMSYLLNIPDRLGRQ